MLHDGRMSAHSDEGEPQKTMQSPGVVGIGGPILRPSIDLCPTTLTYMSLSYLGKSTSKILEKHVGIYM